MREPFRIAGDFQWREFGNDFHAAFVGERPHQFHAIGTVLEKSNFIRFICSCPASSRASSSSAPINFRIRCAARWQASMVCLYSAASRSRFKRGLCLRQNDGDGRAEFVRGVGGELFLLRERGVEAREGGIQNGGELAEFAFRFGDLMRCDKSPEEIFTAAELISRPDAATATQSTSRPQVRKIK